MVPIEFLKPAGGAANPFLVGLCEEIPAAVTLPNTIQRACFGHIENQPNNVVGKQGTFGVRVLAAACPDFTPRIPIRSLAPPYPQIASQRIQNGDKREPFKESIYVLEPACCRLVGG